MTRTQVIFNAINVALTGPSKDPRRKGSVEDRMQYLTDAVEAALDKHGF